MRSTFSTSNSQGSNYKARDLQVCWANVRKGNSEHDALLSLAFEEGIDVICVQEPWVGHRTSTKTHPGYHTIAPLDNWDWDTLEEYNKARPRVITYVLKSPYLITQQH